MLPAQLEQWSAVYGSPDVVPSAMSKAGIEVMTKSLAIEWARFSIRLNAVGPLESFYAALVRRPLSAHL